MDANYLLDNGLHYYSPTHPQALHAMKMRLAYEQMPQIFSETIRFFTHGMYLSTDFSDLVISMFALIFDESEIDSETFNYLLAHIVVDEDAVLISHGSTRYVSEEWLELDFSSRGDALWNKANEILSRINKFCFKVGIIPPLRPYAVFDKEIDTTEDHIVIVANPEAK